MDFNFPSPVAPAAELDPLPNEEDDFMLQTEEQAEIQLPHSDDDDGSAAAGDLGGFDVNLPDQASDAGSPAAVAGIIGGGLREEPLTAKNRKQKKLSRHGIPVPTLPKGVVKRLATRFARVGAGAKAKINKETLAAVEQASEWFFEQASEDLATFAKHAGRKTVDESDVMTLMRRYTLSFLLLYLFYIFADCFYSLALCMCRQRLVNNTNTVFSLAQKNLPKELLQDIRLSMPP